VVYLNQKDSPACPAKHPHCQNTSPQIATNAACSAQIPAYGFIASPSLSKGSIKPFLPAKNTKRTHFQVPTITNKPSCTLSTQTRFSPAWHPIGFVPQARFLDPPPSGSLPFRDTGNWLRSATLSLYWTIPLGRLIRARDSLSNL
jgi:hypothetical protein